MTGALGFVWLVFWIIFYEIPTKQKRLKQSELEHINSDLAENELKETPVKIKWSKLLGLKQTWVFILGKVLTDPIWWFFLFWLPSYFADTFKLNLSKPSTELVVIYFCSTFGSIAGGYLSSYFIKRGWSPLKARKTSLLIAAIAVTPIFLAKYSTNIWQVVAIMSLAMAAHQAWSTNIFTIVSDIVPKKAVSSVVGLGGMSGSIASTLFPLLVGSLLAYYKSLGHITAGYNILFIIAGCTYLLTILIIHLLTRKMKPIEI
jgi:ACS family hexuronate transporter-like MFS transporter